MTKALVCYFSCTSITKRVATKLAKVAGADLFAIEPAVPYTKADLNWMDKSSRTTLEMADPKSRPTIQNKIPDFDDYDTFFVGFPIWWYRAPTLINTFLESYDFAGKTLVVFATSGSSGLGKTEALLKDSVSKEAHWKPGKRLPSGIDEASLASWVKSLNL
jgi:flavodoxin